MKQCTLTFGGYSMLAYKSWFSALRIDADHMTTIAIYTLWTIPYQFSHTLEYKLIIYSILKQYH